MASWALTSSAAAVAKAGVHANATVVADTTTLGVWSDQAEGFLELHTGKSIVADIGNAPGEIDEGIDEIVSSMVAMKIIAADTSGYLAREADTLMNFNNDIINKGIKLLKEWKSTTLNSPFS